MNTSERAEQLAHAKKWLDVWSHKRRMGATESLAAEFESVGCLARGLAIEQAAQIVADWYGHSEADQLGASVEHEIRSLDPDAAQTLAHHNATVFQDTLDDLKHDGSELVVGGKEPVRIFSEKELAAHDAEIKRLARLDEAKLHAHDGLGPYQLEGSGWTPEQLETHMRCCRDCQRIAALAESQPAPAKQENPLTRSERWDKCISYIEKTRTLDEAKHLASLDGFGANTSVWLTAFSKLLQRRPAPAKEDK